MIADASSEQNQEASEAINNASQASVSDSALLVTDIDSGKQVPENTEEASVLVAEHEKVDKNFSGVSDQPSKEALPQKTDDRDLSLVFGPGATDIADNLLSGKEGISKSDSLSSEASAETSTPLRQQSRGRRRTRNSGRSSKSSPSPIRPPDILGCKKPRIEGEDIGGSNDEELVKKGQNDQCDLDNSGDWGSSFEQLDTVKLASETSTEKMEENVSQAAVTPSVERDSDQNRVLQGTLKIDKVDKISVGALPNQEDSH